MHSVPDAHILPGGTANRGVVERIGNALEQVEQAPQAGAAPGAINTIGAL
jgi:hypothetical protein